jgi:TatD DNase family protein
MQRARSAGVSSFLCCGTSEGDWDAVNRVAQRFEGVRAAYGLHPWFVARRSPQWLDRLDCLIGGSARAVGEIGLDHALEHRNDAQQYEVFMQQLRLARAHRKPVSIHCRRAWGALIEALEAEGGVPHGGVVHCYSGAPELVSRLERLGCSISFAGSISRRGNKRGRASLSEVSEGRLLIETDSPDIAPVGVESHRNEPANMVVIRDRIAELLAISPEVVETRTWRNAGRLFGE